MKDLYRMDRKAGTQTVFSPLTAFSVKSLRLSAFRFADNRDIELDFFDSYDLGIKDSTCLQECQENEDCFAFDETVDGECGSC